MTEHPVAADQVDKCVESIPVPPTPQVVKSSSEILCELFGAFNATPPSLDDIAVPEEPVQNILDKKHKKQSKKKSKKTKKKKKKRSRSSSSNSKVSNESKNKKKKQSSKHSTSESESVSSKKKKRKLGKYSASDSDDESKPKSKKRKINRAESSSKYKLDNVKIKQEKDCINTPTVPDLIQENILKHAVSRIVDKVIDSTKLKTQVYDTIGLSNQQSGIKHLVSEKPKIDVKTEPSSPEQLKNGGDQCKIASSSSNGVLEEIIAPIHVTTKETEDFPKALKDEQKDKESDKIKSTTGKIKIQNLKFSQVYEATVKQIEEEAKRKAEKYEEGEISESSSEEKSPTPSLLSSSESVVEVTPEEKKRKHRHHSKKGKYYRHRKRSRSKEKHNSYSHCHSRHKKRSRSEERWTDDRRKSSSRSRERSRDRSKKWRKSRESSSSRSREGSREISNERRKSRSDEKGRDKKKGRRRSISRDRSKDRTKDKRNKDRSRSRNRNKDWVFNRRRSKENSRSPEKKTDRKNEREGSEEGSKSHDKNKERASSKERSKKAGHGHSDYTNSRDKDKIKRGLDEKIDKQKLLEIARKNALSMMKGGSALLGQNKVVSITAGGKTVSELTDFCKLLSQKDAEGHESISSDTEPSSGSESENRPFHHPFQLKDRNASIVLNIRNSVALPVKSLQEKTAEQARELRLQFPVSSGQHHRKTESEWIPVSPKRPEPLAITAPPPPVPPVRRKRTFTDTPDPPMIEWRDVRQEPLEHMGQFTGSTGVKVLTQAELAAGQQAWARRDQLQVAAPVNSGMGMTLLQKMGWRPGEGLGKNKEGALQPLLLEVKTDKKGLVAQEELPTRQPHQIIRRTQRSLEGKHPVSLLNEYCSRRKYSSPQFELIDEAGPDHKKNFRFKVKVNGIEYTPAVGSPKKKQARAEAAEICLKELGILPMMR